MMPQPLTQWIYLIIEKIQSDMKETKIQMVFVYKYSIVFYSRALTFTTEEDKDYINWEFKQTKFLHNLNSIA